MVTPPDGLQAERERSFDVLHRAAVEPRGRRVDELLSHPQAAGLVDLRGIAGLLGGIGVSTVERLMRQGLPSLDLGEHHPKRRPKRLLRFDPEEVLCWVRANCRNGGSR